ncbi:MAG: SurA N-terminal domain-containing protein [Candidatus Andeanibacterium colombiense]|uniref:SurA N-terminal domain-containing protein n=1 Tax=Candidatus Andeanibacterium colombiense TaxID=3121345 RepID=A0AAJ6BPS4_9SPHN|nr:MAG: SurA N-terminal domain-containing protein [Sphingomonadaceae bacterium]
MLTFFRAFMNSKAGVFVTLAFLILIGLAFAAGDISNTGAFSGLSKGDRVAIVGKRKISIDELEAAARTEFDNARQRNPTMTMEAFVAAGGLEDTLTRMINGAAISQFGQNHGLRAGDRLVDSEIVKIPAFSGADGKFDEGTYRQFLAQRKLTDAQVREDLSNELFSRQITAPVGVPGALPQSLVARYASLLRERRHGQLGLLLSDAYAPKAAPTDAQLQAFYTAHRAAYMRAERRVIRYASFGAAELKNIPAPTDAEIAARYARDGALYSGGEKRRLTQLVVPTQAAASAIAAEVAQGKTLAAAAGAKGLAVAAIGPIDKAALTSQASAAVADTVFATAQGKLSAPARGGLGWYVMRVDGVEKTPGRTLAQVRGEISSALATEKHNAALTDMSSKIEEEFENGSSLADVAKELGLTLQATPELVGTGQVYGKAGETAPKAIAPVLKTAFDMDEGQPQLTEIEAGNTFMIFDVSSIVPAAAAPLGEIREAVIAGWRHAEGGKKAKEAADRVLKRVAEGQTVAAAMAKEGIPLPPPDTINMTREELFKLGSGRVPPVMALMFSMAEGTVKRLEAPNDNGWFVAKLDDIEPGKLAPNDDLIVKSGQQLAQSAGQEYGEEFVAAALKEVGVERNKDAIETARKRLVGGN